jgi:hypothetical protein
MLLCGSAGVHVPNTGYTGYMAAEIGYGWDFSRFL